MFHPISKTKSNGGVNLIYLFGVDGMQRVYPELNNYFLMVLLVEVIIIVTRLNSKVFSLERLSKFWVPKYLQKQFWSENKFQTKLCVRKKIWSEKILCQKKFGSEKNIGSEKILGQTKFWVLQLVCSVIVEFGVVLIVLLETWVIWTPKLSQKPMHWSMCQISAF